MATRRKKNPEITLTLPNIENGDGWNNLKAKLIVFCTMLQDAVAHGVNDTTQENQQFWAEVERRADEMASDRNAAYQQEQTT